MNALQDQFGRQKRKLRISITDRCNFRCPYCMPEKPRWMPASNLLNAEEISQLAAYFVQEYGISNIRITGGEPLLRKDLPDILRHINQLKDHGLQRLSMTSNAARLAQQASVLKQAGLDDINISLDSLEPEQFQRLSRGRYGLADVLTGIQTAQDVGLPVKLNCVIIKGYNDDQVLPLLNWAHEHSLQLRFIEFMPLDEEQLWDKSRVLSAADILRTIEQEHSLKRLPRDGEPAQLYELDNGQRFGIIATVTEPFCGDCDRLRLTANGSLYTCLFAGQGTALKDVLHDPDQLNQRIRDAVWNKGKGYIAQPGYVEREVKMYTLGG